MYTLIRCPKKGEYFNPRTYLVYDKQEKTIFETVVYNDDYSNNKNFTMAFMSSFHINNEIAFFMQLEADELIEANENGQLKGRLKEIAAGLKEEDNPVIMVVTYKK